MNTSRLCAMSKGYLPRYVQSTLWVCDSFKYAFANLVGINISPLSLNRLEWYPSKVQTFRGVIYFSVSDTWRSP